MAGCFLARLAQRGDCVDHFLSLASVPVYVCARVHTHMREWGMGWDRGVSEKKRKKRKHKTSL